MSLQVVKVTIMFVVRDLICLFRVFRSLCEMKSYRPTNNQGTLVPEGQKVQILSVIKF